MCVVSCHWNRSPLDGLYVLLYTLIVRIHVCFGLIWHAPIIQWALSRLECCLLSCVFLLLGVPMVTCLLQMNYINQQHVFILTWCAVLVDVVDCNSKQLLTSITHYDDKLSLGDSRFEFSMRIVLKTSIADNKYTLIKLHLLLRSASVQPLLVKQIFTF